MQSNCRRFFIFNLISILTLTSLSAAAGNDPPLSIGVVRSGITLDPPDFMRGADIPWGIGSGRSRQNQGYVPGTVAQEPAPVVADGSFRMNTEDRLLFAGSHLRSTALPLQAASSASSSISAPRGPAPIVVTSDGTALVAPNTFPAPVFALIQTFTHAGDALRLIFGVVQMTETFGRGRTMGEFTPILAAIVRDMTQPGPQNELVEIPRIRTALDFEMNGEVVSNPTDMLVAMFTGAQNSQGLLLAIQGVYHASVQSTIAHRLQLDNPMGGISQLDHSELIGSRSAVVAALLGQYRRHGELGDEDRADLTREAGWMMAHGANLGGMGTWAIEELVGSESETTVPLRVRAEILVQLVINGYVGADPARIYNFILRNWEASKTAGDANLARLRQLVARLAVFMIQRHPTVNLHLTSTLINDLFSASTRTRDGRLASQVQKIQAAFFKAGKSAKPKVKAEEKKR